MEETNGKKILVVVVVGEICGSGSGSGSSVGVHL